MFNGKQLEEVFCFGVHTLTILRRNISMWVYFVRCISHFLTRWWKAISNIEKSWTCFKMLSSLRKEIDAFMNLKIVWSFFAQSYTLPSFGSLPCHVPSPPASSSLPYHVSLCSPTRLFTASLLKSFDPSLPIHVPLHSSLRLLKAEFFEPSLSSHVPFPPAVPSLPCHVPHAYN